MLANPLPVRYMFVKCDEGGENDLQVVYTPENLTSGKTLGPLFADLMTDPCS
jgi:hypothetical protein